MPEKKYDTPLVKKLGIKPGHRLLFVDEPDDFRDLLVGLPRTWMSEIDRRTNRPT